MIAMLALLFGAQQIACACPVADELITAHDHRTHASHGSEHAHSDGQQDESRGACSHCEPESVVTAGGDDLSKTALPETPVSYFVPRKTLRLASYSPTDSPRPVIRDDGRRRLTPLQLRVQLLI